MSDYRQTEADEAEAAGEVAGLSARLMAFLIDWALLACGSLGSAFLFGWWLWWTPISWLGGGSLFLVSGIVAPIAVALPYFLLFPVWFGQTLGKMALGIVVISTSGEALAPGQSFLRLVGYLLSALPLFWGFLWASVDGEGRGWHDHLAATRVILKKSP